MILLALFMFQAELSTQALGSKVFQTGCAVGYCHGSGGSANRGPRLRGRNLERGYIERVTHNGIPNSAMPGFKDRLKPDELEAVIAYVVNISSDNAAAAPTTAAPVAGTKPAVSEKPTRLESLFFDPLRETRCGSCHELKSKGIKLATLSEKNVVKRVKLRNGDSFPALVVAQNEETVRVYDLTIPPPVLRSFDPAQVASVGTETQWTHAMATSEYQPAELTEIRRLLNQP